MAAEVLQFPGTVDGLESLFQTPGPDAGYFVDWITVSQSYGQDSGVPEHIGTWSIVMDETGEPDYEAAKGRTHRGSYSTSLQIRSHKGTVSVSGNVGRFGRPDNLFGLTLAECMQLINEELSRNGLPGFTPGLPLPRTEEPGKRGPVWTGARFSRLDVTRNYSAGSEFLAGLVMRAYTRMSRARMKANSWEGESAQWHTRRRCVKAYLKGPEMLKHAKQSPWIDWATQNGIVRHELELRSDYLGETRLCYWGNLDMAQLIQLHRQETAHLTDIDATIDPMAVEHVPARSRLVYAAWLRGESVRDHMSRATYYRHAKVLRETAGVEIGDQRHTAQIHTIVRTVELAAAVPPAGYWMRAA